MAFITSRLVLPGMRIAMFESLEYQLWLTGVNRLYLASWTAARNYGKDANEISVRAEYFSLLSECLSNIVLALGAEVVLDTDEGDFLI